MTIEIFVINLARRPDRLGFMNRQLGDLGLSYTRVEAIDGFADEDFGYPAAHPRLSKGEYACYLSHVKAWKLFIASGAERCLVLEDDVVLSDSLPEILAHSAFFEHKGAVTRLESRIYSTRVSLFFRHRFRNRKLVRLHAYDGGAGALVLTRDYINFLLENHSIPQVPVDDVTLNPVENEFRPHIVYQLDPAAAIQRHFLNPDHPEFDDESDLDATRGKPIPLRRQKGIFQKFARHLRQRIRNFHHNTLTTVKVIPFNKD